MNAISQHCYHVEVSPGQTCPCLDALMRAKLTIECLSRRVGELEAEAQNKTWRRW